MTLRTSAEESAPKRPDSSLRSANEAGAAGTRTDSDLSLGRAMLIVNGQAHHLILSTTTTLADALREQVGLSGTKVGCNHGQCGACTVHVEGRRVLACLTLAATCQGKEINTIEGLSGDNGSLHPMQQAFIDQDAFQCGYCTPGQIMSAVALVEEGRLDSVDQIREYMSGNLCRCGAYPKILAAVLQGASAMKG